MATSLDVIRRILTRFRPAPGMSDAEVAERLKPHGQTLDIDEPPAPEILVNDVEPIDYRHDPDISGDGIYLIPTDPEETHDRNDD